MGKNNEHLKSSESLTGIIVSDVHAVSDLVHRHKVGTIDIRQELPQ